MPLPSFYENQNYEALQLITYTELLSATLIMNDAPTARKYCAS